MICYYSGPLPASKKGHNKATAYASGSNISLYRESILHKQKEERELFSYYWKIRETYYNSSLSPSFSMYNCSSHFLTSNSSAFVTKPKYFIISSSS